MGSVFNLVERLLPTVTKPNRYVGNELNRCAKPLDSASVSVLLAFPDVYEVGMSHLGIRILYHVLNGRDGMVAELTFAPWFDMEEGMRTVGLPLFSMESHTPAREFDIVGFSLQYELHYSTVTNMLDLAQVPLRSSDRGPGDPVVIAGGPCAHNPEPLADFLDAVVIGDGEEVVVEIAQAVRDWKERGGTRGEMLMSLAHIPGVYVPSLYSIEYDRAGTVSRFSPRDGAVPTKVTARMLAELRDDLYPASPLVSLIETTHDRLSLEIMRGCGRGCRFCLAGYAGRPVRFRPVESVVALAEAGIAASGWDEVSLLSLSALDYRGLSPLITRLNGALCDQRVAVSLPSLRPDGFSPEIARGVGVVKQTGLTFAPEAGSQRLRDILGKGMTEEEVMTAIRSALEAGWRKVKLYFMVGLPGEEEGDLDALVKLLMRCGREAKASGGGGFNVSLSPFVAKAHTPFQWEKQQDAEEVDKRLTYIRRRVPKGRIRLRWRDPSMSEIEGVLARGDRRLGEPLLDVWRAGGKFEGWSDHFKADRWRQVLERHGIAPEDFLRSRDPEERLPWQHIGLHAGDRMLVREREVFRRLLAGDQEAWAAVDRARAEAGETVYGDSSQTQTEVVTAVTAAVDAEAGTESTPEEDPSRSISYGRKRVHPRPYDHRGPNLRTRSRYAKGREVRFISHLDLTREICRALRRAKLPVAYTQGHHPHPRISFGPPLPLGMTSSAEYFDLEFTRPVPEDWVDRLNSTAVPGISIVEVATIFGHSPSLTSILNLATYSATIPSDWLEEVLVKESGCHPAPNDDDGWVQFASQRVERFLASDHLEIETQGPKGIKRRDVRGSVREMTSDVQDEKMLLRFSLVLKGDALARPGDVLRAVLGVSEEMVRSLMIQRTGLFVEDEGRLYDPIESLHAGSRPSES